MPPTLVKTGSLPPTTRLQETPTPSHPRAQATTQNDNPGPTPQTHGCTTRNQPPKPHPDLGLENNGDVLKEKQSVYEKQ